jgi:hypothetical protein
MSPDKSRLEYLNSRLNHLLAKAGTAAVQADGDERGAVWGEIARIREEINTLESA